MTAPRIISAAEAEELRQASDAAIETMTAAGAGEAETRAAVLVRDLAASVVELHAEVERAADAERARIAARIKELADKAYAAGNEPRGDQLLNASRIVQTSRVAP